MTTIKVSGITQKWRQAVRSENGFIGISLDSPNFTGKRLETLIDWINDNTCFTNIKISLSDTLNRHNYMLPYNLSEAAAHAKSVLAGDQWLKDNKRALNALEVPFDIIRWDYWLYKHNAEVEKNKEIFSELYAKNDSEINLAINKDLNGFFTRKHNKTIDQLPHETVQKSLNYIIEELAVYSIIFNQYPSTKIYPGNDLNCFTAIRESQIPDIPPGIPNSEFVGLKIWSDSKEGKPTNDNNKNEQDTNATNSL